MKLTRVAAVLACGLAWRLAAPDRATAQGDFAGLKVKPGDIVYVTDTATGVEVSGRLATLSPLALSIDGYRFEPAPTIRVERRGDSDWNGAAIGFGIGACVLYPIVRELSRRAGPFRPMNGLLWAAVGAVIDHAHVGRTTVYSGSPRARRK